MLGNIPKSAKKSVTFFVLEFWHPKKLKNREIGNLNNPKIFEMEKNWNWIEIVSLQTG